MVRFAGLSRAATAVLVVTALCGPAAAQDHRDPAAKSVQAVEATQPAAAPAIRSIERRPTALVPLYASFAALQVLDALSTNDALAHGGSEANPTLRGLAGSPVALAAVKAAGTAGVIFVSERLRKKNRAAAIGLMIAANSMMAWVVQHNYRQVR